MIPDCPISDNVPVCLPQWADMRYPTSATSLSELPFSDCILSKSASMDFFRYNFGVATHPPATGVPSSHSHPRVMGLLPPGVFYLSPLCTACWYNSHVEDPFRCPRTETVQELARILDDEQVVLVRAHPRRERRHSRSSLMNMMNSTMFHRSWSDLGRKMDTISIPTSSFNVRGARAILSSQRTISTIATSSS